MPGKTTGLPSEANTRSLTSISAAHGSRAGGTRVKRKLPLAGNGEAERKPTGDRRRGVGRQRGAGSSS
jgi:hypothetical protein